MVSRQEAGRPEESGGRERTSGEPAAPGAPAQGVRVGAARSRRSRLSPQRERELLDTALVLVRERGYDQVTMDDIARATRSSTATLYRRWDSKARLVITALRTGKPRLLAGLDTGSLRGDLMALSERARRSVPGPGPAMGSLFQAVLLDPELMRALRELMLEPDIEALGAVLQRHVDSGEIAPDNPVLDLVDRLLFGPMFVEQLYLGGSRAAELAHRIVDDVLLPLLTRPDRG
ncbi:TetR/AcrR family transcriptional regulator [Actinacidiphila acididurans]|uniref:TetR/AcrR family transcriptional regulator n=1 Tax=Actinacidiphila acididurans TaxID=2784346 RepID=A0ABS2TL60_9ACTN|nr:TetR/AcrR family transcriptional regulator [Actinacidiphila acididurans]MBM9503246.1 TetR/AcrR family transcriptional regulator [Actinacidiphila acididurans]